MVSEKFIGTGVAIVTPFRQDGSIDFNSFGKHIEFLIENKIDYLVVLGTTGESATLSKEEKEAVISFAVETVAKRIPVVVGIGGNHTQAVIDCIKSTNLEGVDAILSVTPYYNKPTQKGLFLHYRNLASVCTLPIILYNVPGRTQCNMSAETTLKLAKEVKNIIAIKEASGDFSQIIKIIKDKPKDFLVISGDDAIVVPLMSIGASGIISVAANAFPKEISDMIRFALNNEYDKASLLQLKLDSVINSLFVEGNPAGVKAAMHSKGLTPNNLRLPLTPVSEETYNKISNLIKSI